MLHPAIRRERELELIERALRDTEPPVVLLHGQPGVGKSTVLEAVAARATGRALRATAVRTEAELPFSTLHLLLHGVLEGASDLSATARAALEITFGRASGGPPSAMVLRQAVLDLLMRIGGAEGLLLVLDDIQWMDAASAEVLAYVARRPPPATAALLCRRDDAAGSDAFDALDLETVELLPLAEAGAVELLDHAHPGLADPLRSRVLEVAAGNPLALVELPLAAAHSGWTSGEPLPLTHRLERSFGHRASALDPSLRSALLEAALDDANEPAGGRLEAALGTGLVVRHRGGTMGFRHPLVRSAIVAAAAAAERRAAHRALAERYRGSVERRAMHLAAATTGPDEAIAALLEAAGRRQVLRGAAAPAIGVLVQAATLSPDPAAAAGRLRHAAFLAGQVGDRERSEALLRSAAALDDTVSAAGAITAGLNELFVDGAAVSAEPRLMVALAAARTQGDSSVADRVRVSLLSLAMFRSDESVQVRVARAVALPDGTAADPLLDVFRRSWSDLSRAPADLPDRVRAALATADDHEPWTLMRLLVSAYATGVVDEFRPLLDRMLDREADAGAMVSALISAQVRVLDRIDAGCWAAARAEGEAIVGRTRTFGLGLLEHQTLAYLGLLAADEGRTADALEVADVVEGWGVPRRIGLVTEHGPLIRARVALAAGDHDHAFRLLVTITRPGRFPQHAHLATRSLLDLVEAAMHSGRTGQAREHALAARRTALPAFGARYRLLVGGALAMTAPPAVARRGFEEVLADPGAAGVPFDAARVRLAYAATLRRAGDRSAARDELAAAHQTFRTLGAAPWAERAAALLRASGGMPDPVDEHGLTSQERRIAALAASGLTNREIGEQLHLSPRTIGSHLYRAFPKLGVRTRAALRDALG